jgi:hypothetical protein
MTRISLTDDEAELAILALETFKREHASDYHEEDRPAILRDLSSTVRKLREA